jgi:hypothetical protein
LLNYEEQCAFVLDLRKSLRDSEIWSDARSLLEKLRARRDLFATVAVEIDAILKEPLPTSSDVTRDKRSDDLLAISTTGSSTVVLSSYSASQSQLPSWLVPAVSFQ